MAFSRTSEKLRRPQWSDGRPQSRRKMSQPLVMASLEVPQITGKRRFSQVSDAVTRRFSQTLNWGHPRRQLAAAQVIAQGRSLCGQYVGARLRRSGGPTARKLGIQRVRSSTYLGGRHVFPELLALGRELERLHPKVYTAIVRQTCHVLSEKGLAIILPTVSRRLMSCGVSWPRIASLYAVAGGLALDCVSQGRPEYLQVIIDSMTHALEQDIALWIADNGGWGGLLNFCKPQGQDHSVSVVISLLAVLAGAVSVVIALAVNFYSKYNHD